jgi:hypothetical protein
MAINWISCISLILQQILFKFYGSSLYSYRHENLHLTNWINLLSYPIWANNVATDFRRIFFAEFALSLGGGDPCPSENALKENL